MYYTTLKRFHKHCDNSNFASLLKRVGKTEADDEPLSLRDILDANGLDNAMLALAVIDDCPEKRLFAVRCVRQSAQHLLTDPRSLDALDVAELYAIGEATDEELAAAQAAVEAARVAARAVANDAADDAWNAARAAAWNAAWATARYAAEAAALAARVAAWDAANDAAWDAMRQDFIDIFCS